MLDAHKLLVTIETYNEVENLPHLVDEIFPVLPQVDLLVIDDNSPDGTIDGAAANESGGTAQATTATCSASKHASAWVAAVRTGWSCSESGDEARQLEAVAKAKNLGDGGLIVLALAAGSDRQSVRHKALQSALELGTDGFVVIRHAFENLSDADRIFLVQQGLKDLTPSGCWESLRSMGSRRPQFRTRFSTRRSRARSGWSYSR